MKLDYYKPKNNLLKQYIEGYYFISEDKNSTPIKYHTFPNNFCILSVNQNAKVEFKENVYFVSSDKTDEILADIVVRYTEPIEVVYENVVDVKANIFRGLTILTAILFTIVYKKNRNEKLTVNKLTILKKKNGI